MLQRLYQGGSDETVHALSTLALLQPPDQPRKALAMFRQALDMNQSLHPGDHDQTVALMWNVGTAEVELGKAASGEAILQAALDMSRRVRPEQPMLISHSWGFLAYANRALGKFAEAEQCCTESYETYKNMIGQPTWERAGKQRNLGLAKLEAGKPAEGEVLCTSALTYLAPREQPLTALTQSDRARCRWLLGRRDEARSDFDGAVAIMRRLAGPNGGGPGLAEVLFHSATARIEANDIAAALTELQEADNIAQRTMAPERQLRRDIRAALLKCQSAASEPTK
jgi:tetratricopeptide (TPR) repeat protein